MLPALNFVTILRHRFEIKDDQASAFWLEWSPDKTADEQRRRNDQGKKRLKKTERRNSLKGKEQSTEKTERNSEKWNKRWRDKRVRWERAGSKKLTKIKNKFSKNLKMTFTTWPRFQCWGFLSNSDSAFQLRFRRNRLFSRWEQLSLHVCPSGLLVCDSSFQGCEFN